MLPIRILLVDDHGGVRKGLREFLRLYPNFEVVGEASNGEEAVRAVHRLSPAGVVKDINMPGINGIEATREITSSYVGLSMNADLHRQAMIRAGTATVLVKDLIAAELPKTIMDYMSRSFAPAVSSLQPAL